MGAPLYFPAPVGTRLPTAMVLPPLLGPPPREARVAPSMLFRAALAKRAPGPAGLMLAAYLGVVGGLLAAVSSPRGPPPPHAEAWARLLAASGGGT